ncbi:MAG: hypothetical protein ACK5LL_10125 [Suipraeoptans sp.]
MHLINKHHSSARQEHQSRLVSSILEYTQGISVIKAFNLKDERAANVTNAIKMTNKKSIEYESELVIPYVVCELPTT